MRDAGGDVDGMPARWGALTELPPTERDSQSDGRVWSRDRPQSDPGPGAAPSPSPSPGGAEHRCRVRSGPRVIQQRERPAMVDRARAFKQRVLKKLYCSSPLEKIKESRAKQEQREAERKTTNNDAIGAAQIVPEGRKLYTVSLPSEYEVCATRPSEKDESEESSEQPEGRHSTKNFQRKRKRQRKCKSSVHEGLSEKAQTEFQQLRMVQTDSLQAVTLDSAKPEAEILTKNRRRKLKKKRHKEKLRAAGLVTKATAVELIYQPDENSNDDIAEGGKIVGVMDSNET